MDSDRQELLLQWIIADHLPFSFAGRHYFLSTPSREARFCAELIYKEVYEEGLQIGLYDDSDILSLLKKNHLWDINKQAKLDKLVKDIDDIKVNIFLNYTNSGRRDQFRRALRDTENYITKMLLEKSSFDSYGAKSVANYAKQHFLMGSSIFRTKNKSIFKGEWWSRKDDDIIQHCYKVMSDYILSESDYRILSRCTNWRNIWSARKGSNLFGRAGVDLSHPQRQLILWTNMYDNVYKNSNCPADAIIEDDDALDGWMIHQRRERDKETNKDLIERSLKNEKIRNSEQVYIMCDPTFGDVVVDDPNKVYECNDQEGKMRHNSIMKQVEKEGSVGLMGLKDTQRQIYRKAAEMRGAT